MSNKLVKKRVLSGIRATGKMHLGNYHGAIKGWLELQENDDYDCYFFIADLHGLTTHYQDSANNLSNDTFDLIKDLLSTGIDPNKVTLFVQSAVPEHCELCVLLGMITPLSWLERIPTFKDQQQKLSDRDLSTLGFLSYPLLQSADILLYKPHLVPVGEDQLYHIELTREIARRFNNFYGQKDLAENIDLILNKLHKELQDQINLLKSAYQQTGDDKALQQAYTLIESLHLPEFETEVLEGFIIGNSRAILPNVQAMLTKDSKVYGLDGQKMSKSYHNTIAIGEDPDVVTVKIKKMPTDPARIKRTDPGDPLKCPVWNFHTLYSSADTQEYIDISCRTAAIGCLDCKKIVIDAINKEQAEIRERRLQLDLNPQIIIDIMNRSTEKARRVAKTTLDEVKAVMGIWK